MPINITENRINTVMPKLVVYRMSKSELGNSIVTLQGGNSSNDTTAYLRFTMNATGSPAGVWAAFKEWWKKNNNLIILGCMIHNVDTSGNKGFYWCPTNRCPNPIRTDAYTNYLEFVISRNDNGIYNNESQTIYEFYFINLSH